MKQSKIYIFHYMFGVNNVHVLVIEEKESDND